jgi:carboxyl-terminal processing protease
MSKQVYELTEVILRHHIDPPTRQQMLLGGLKSLYGAADLTIPAGLSRRVSLTATPEQLMTLLTELWPAHPRRRVSTAQLEEAFTGGLLGTIPGGAYLSSSKEHRVQEQLQGNRYVGIHIQLSYDEKTKRSQIQATVPGGPADLAGAKAGDQIEEVDGVDTKDMKLAQVVDRLRGPEGTEVLVKVRQPKSKEIRILKMTRSVLFLPTVVGLRKKSAREWDYRVTGADPIAYLRIRDISASTPHELRKLAHELDSQGLRSLILDLRELSTSVLHPTVLLADSLLDHGRIGQVRMADRVMTYEATEDVLFRGWPIVALIDSGTAGAAEWLAASLQDNHRATIVGSVSMSGRPAVSSRRPVSLMGPAEMHTAVPLGDGSYLTLVSGRFERGDGRSLVAPPLVQSAAEEASPRSGQEAEQVPGGGVQPDVRVGSRDPRWEARSRARRGSIIMEEPPLDPASDACVTKAVEMLRMALRKA